MLRLLDRVLTVVCVAAVVLLVVGLFAGPAVIGAKKKNASYKPPSGTAPSAGCQ